jgi:hypothetical protein
MKTLGCQRVKCISTNYNKKIEGYYSLFNHDMTYVTLWYCTKNSTRKHTQEILLGLRSKLKFMKLCREPIYNIDYNFPRTFTEKQLLQSWEGNYSLQKHFRDLIGAPNQTAGAKIPIRCSKASTWSVGSLRWPKQM